MGWTQGCSDTSSGWDESCSEDTTSTTTQPLLVFLLSLGRVLFVQDGLLTAGEIATPDAQMVYAGPSGASSVVFGCRTYLRPNPLDWAAGTIFNPANNAQKTARYYTPVTQPQNWTPDTDGYTFITFALGQYTVEGPNTRTYQALAINEETLDNSWQAHYLMHGQQTVEVDAYAERAYTVGTKGLVSDRSIEDMFNVDNGTWTGNSLGPIAWGWGTVSNGTTIKTFWQRNSGTVDFNSPVGGSAYSANFPSNVPAVHLFLNGHPTTQTPRGSSADAQIGVSILVPYAMSDSQIQSVFDALNNCLSLTPVTVTTGVVWDENCESGASEWQSINCS